MDETKDPVVIVSAMRTPLGHFNGYFKQFSAVELGTAAVKGAIEKANLKPKDIHEVLMGCVLPAGLGQAPARQVSIQSGIPTSAHCVTINKVCGSGMKTVMFAHDELLAYTHDIIVAGGMENMTQAPYLLPKARFGYRLGDGEILDHMILDGLENPYDLQSMGYFADLCATKYKISRQEQDEYAISSYQRTQEATDKNLFSDYMVPITITDKHGNSQIFHQDEGLSVVNLEKIPKLHPAFSKEGTVTAANSSQISDGAAALVLMRQSEAKKRGLQPIAKILGHFSHSQDPVWFTTAPIGAIAGLLNKIRLNKNEIDLYEINEAFAVVPIIVMRELQIPHEKVNVYGGACTLGHPIGATGARIIVTLLNALHTKKLRYGIASLCIGGGEATAIALEAV